MKSDDCQNMVKSLVNIYHHVRINQLKRYAEYFNLQDDFSSAITRLGHSGNYTVSKNEVSLRQCKFSYAVKVMDKTDEQILIKALEKAFVILTDFFTAVSVITHFPTYNFPYVLIFATDTEVYEILYVKKGREKIAGRIMLFKDEDTAEDGTSNIEPASKRIVIVDSTDQIPQIHIKDIYSYAVVNEDSGFADYYPVNNPLSAVEINPDIEISKEGGEKSAHNKIG